MGNVRETHWAKSDQERFTEFCEALPSVLETQFSFWQRRVDTKGLPHKWQPHGRLLVVEAQKYEMKNGRFQPAEPEVTHRFLVAGETSRDAGEKVYRYLEDHGYDRQEWSMRFISHQFFLA